MATLEKIRSKSVLLIVIIGVALLAFIVGDALTNSRNLFGDQTTVAKIGRDKIDYTEYQQKREELNQQLEQARRQNPQQYANFDTQLLAQMAIDQLITEHLIDDAVNKAGIRTSGEQLRFYILESGAQIPELSSIIQSLNQNGISAATPQQAYEVIFNPKQNGLTDQQVAPYQRAWLAMEENVKKLVRRQTYQRLLTGTVKANALDKKALHNDYVSTSRVSLAFMPYGQLNEKEYPVSDSELQTAYNAEKNKFKVEEPTKDVSFISVAVQPSQADRNAAKQLAAKAVASLKDSTQGQLSKDLKKAGLATEKKALRLSDIPNGPVKNFISAANAGDVQIVSEGLAGFTIIKMGKRSAKVDSIQLNLVQVAGTKLPSQVLQSLNAGLNVDSLTTKFPVDSVMSSPAQWIPLYTAEGATQALQQSQLDSLLNAGGRFIQLMSTPQGSVIAQIAKQSPAKEVVEFEQVDYDLKPSAATMNEARTKLEKFLAANNTAEKFSKAAQKAGYNVQNFSLTSSTPAVPRMAGMQSFYPESRQVVRWVMIDGKPGEVSHIYESKDALHPMLYAVAIDREYEDFMPLANQDVKTYITEKVRRDKAGDKLVKTYKANASSVANAAKAMGVQAQDSVIVRFGRNNMINDANIAARIAGEKPGKVVVVKGNDGVYVYQIVGKNTENFPYNDQQFEQTYYQQFNPDFNAMLRGTKKFKNNAYKFEAGD